MEQIDSWIALGAILVFIVIVFAAVMLFIGRPSDMDGGL